MTFVWHALCIFAEYARIDSLWVGRCDGLRKAAARVSSFPVVTGRKRALKMAMMGRG